MSRNAIHLGVELEPIIAGVRVSKNWDGTAHELVGVLTASGVETEVKETAKEADKVEEKGGIRRTTTTSTARALPRYLATRLTRRSRASQVLARMINDWRMGAKWSRMRTKKRMVWWDRRRGWCRRGCGGGGPGTRVEGQV